PRRYRALVREMETRKLLPVEKDTPATKRTALDWIESRPFLERHLILTAIMTSSILFAATTLVTFALYAPIWLFAIPLKILQLETALIYFACAPVPPIVAAGIGRKLGARGFQTIPVLLGV